MRAAWSARTRDVRVIARTQAETQSNQSKTADIKPHRGLKDGGLEIEVPGQGGRMIPRR